MAEESFLVAMKRHLALNGEGPMEFLKRIKELSEEDKQWYYHELKKLGVSCTPPGKYQPPA